MIGGWLDRRTHGRVAFESFDGRAWRRVYEDGFEREFTRAPRWLRRLRPPTLRQLRWRAKQRLAGPGRYYGDGGTIHSSGELDVETHEGKVVSVWFRCQMIPFSQAEVDAARAAEMASVGELPALTGVEVIDPLTALKLVDPS